MSDRGRPINAKELSGILEYFPGSGEILWKTRPREHFLSNRSWKSWNSKWAWKIAGTKAKQSKSSTLSYVAIQISGKRYSAHRIAFALMTGRWPLIVDHIDGNGLNNSRANLREVTASENNKNCKLSTANTSGSCGVYFHKRNKKWTASIRNEGLLLHLGTFNSYDEAVLARKLAQKDFGYAGRHGEKA